MKLARVFALFSLFQLLGIFDANGSSHVLKQGRLEVTIEVDSPEMLREFGPRFDRTAFVRQITWDGKTFLGRWGMPDEFGFLGTGVLGFEEAGIGGTFIKIGVGRLTRNKDDVYKWATRYPVVVAFPVLVEKASENRLTITQASDSTLPWRYRYEKAYQVNGGDTLVVTYSLTNLGKEPFSFEHYNHHFFSLAATPVNEGHELATGFRLTIPKNSPYMVMEYGLHPKSAPPTGESIYYRTALNTASARESTFSLAAAGVKVSYAGDYIPSIFAAYAQGALFCPELFHTEKAMPGETITWKSSYLFSH